MNYWFQKVAIIVCVAFLGVMVTVTFVAFTRKSGKTGMDMGKVQQMRYVAEKKS